MNKPELSAEDIRDAIESALKSWLYQHDIDVHVYNVIKNEIPDSLASAFKEWLDENTEELIAAVAEKEATS